jgi:arylsulfatase A-like enzyme
MRNMCCLMVLAVLFGACAADQPNIIVLLADDLGYGELGCQGNPEIPTPHIDSIAANGVRFTQAYVTAPNCSPSRAGLLTGRIPTRFGYEFNPIGARNEDPGTGIPIKERTLAELLHERGYATGLIGKWHLGGSADFHPQRHGFDEFFGFLHEGHFFAPPPWSHVTTMLRRKTLPGGGQGRWLGDKLIYTTHMGHNEPPYDTDNPILRNSQPVAEQDYLTDAFTREAVDFIHRRKDQPFFLYLAYNAVHSPLQGADKYMAKFAHIEDVHRRIFAAMLANLDDSVGEVLATVRREGLEDNTVIFFLSDNGGPTRELTSSNRPLRGGKGQMYEGGLRIPFLVQWKGVLRAGQVYPELTASVDIFATAAHLAGAAPGNSIDGVDLIPYLTGTHSGKPHETFYWRQGAKTALRKGPWKLVNMNRNLAKPAWELYDIAHDISETENLASQQPGQLQALVTLWHKMNADMKSPLF